MENQILKELEKLNKRFEGKVLMPWEDISDYIEVESKRVGKCTWYSNSGLKIEYEAYHVQDLGTVIKVVG